MPDVFLILGAAIVKSGLKIWLGKDNPAVDAGGSIVDVLKDKISGDLDRRQAQRFFEDLEIPVAKRLRALRDYEFSAMPENEWTAAVLAAGDSFDKARLTSQDLFTRDLDPLYLEREIRISSPNATRDLSDAGSTLYDRVLSEGCAHVIEISDKLPHFQVGAFAELLRRDKQILKLISTVLDRIPEKTEGDSAETQFTTAYVRHIATKMDRLELFGLDFESPWYPLSMAYVSLQTDDLGETEEPPAEQAQGIREAEAVGKGIEDRLAANQRTVILGRAGSGKTTVLQWMAVRAARSDFEGSLAKLNGHIPFFVRLREYVAAALPPPEEFIMGMAPMLAPESSKDWVRNQLRSGKALILVDGVDELPAADRDRVVVWLRDLGELFPSVRYVITARPSAVSTDWLDDLGFTSASLEAMPPSLVSAFIRHWHAAAGHRLTDSDERAQLEIYENSLLKAIESDRYLRDLADTPLLAGLLCALNRHVRSQLPRRRGEIYARALSMFDQRDRARGITDDITLDLAAKTHLLADLAFWMVRNGESEIPEDTAIGQLGRSLPSLPGIPNRPDLIFRALLERSGLLREPAAKRVDFVHRTFQEYLASTAAIDGDAIGELVRNADDDQWREVVIMSAGQANQPQTVELMGGLLTHVRPAAKQARRRLLAVSCLQEVRSLDPDLVQAVEKVIPSLLPPRSLAQAEQLSSAGAPLIPLLAQHWARDAKKVSYTIRAACLVGGPSALDLITDILARNQSTPVQSQSRSRLDDEIMRAWQYFDTEDYARRVISKLTIETMIISELPKLASFLHYATSAARFLFNPFEGPASLQSLSQLPNLWSLSFASVAGKQILGLAACPNIKELRLFGHRSRDLTDMQFPPALNSFVLADSSLESLVGIQNAASLTEVTIRTSPKLKNIDILTQLPNLETITLEHTKDIDIETPALSRSNINIISTALSS